MALTYKTENLQLTKQLLRASGDGAMLYINGTPVVSGVSGALNQTGLFLVSQIVSTGNAAVAHANGIGINLSGNLTLTGQTLFNRDASISGGLEARITATGNAAVAHANSIGTVISGNLTNTGATLDAKINSLSGFTVNVVSGGLEARIIQTGNSAVAHANSIGSVISGNLTQTGVTLWNRDASISGGLEARITATGNAAVAHANSIGSTISGNLTQTGVTLVAQINGLSGVVNTLYGTNLVYTTGAQTITGLKTFNSGIFWNNVGINTASPLNPLHILPTTNGDVTGRISTNSATDGTRSVLGFHLTSNQTADPTTFVGAIRKGTNARSDVVINTANSAGSTQEVIRFTESGNVGIGAANPVQRLQIGDNGTASLGMRIAVPGVNYDITSDSNGNLNFANGGGTFISLVKTPAAVGFLYGNVGVGFSTPFFKLDSNGDINTSGVFRSGGIDITDLYYPRNSNPSGFITGLAGTGSLATLAQLNSLSGFTVNIVSGGLEVRITATGNSVITHANSIGTTISGNLTTTGATLNNAINTGLSWVDQIFVHRTGAELISGNKGFINNVAVGVAGQVGRVLVVSGTTTDLFTNTILWGSTTNQAFALSHQFDSTLNGLSNVHHFRQGGSTAGAIVFSYFGLSGQSMVFTNAGNLGIGINPMAKLHASGDIRSEGAYFSGSVNLADILYPRSNPSGYVTGAALFATGAAAIAHANSIGQTISGNLTQTGITLVSQINGLSGVMNTLYGTNIVYTTGNQTITGVKSFNSGVFWNRVGIGTSSPTYNLEVAGTFAASTKSFVIPHPLISGKRLQHGVIEGPEHAIFVRGKLTGNYIKLPNYWAPLVHEDSITVSLTPIGKYQKLYVENANASGIKVGNANIFGGIHCYYEVKAERKDVSKLITEI